MIAEGSQLGMPGRSRKTSLLNKGTGTSQTSVFAEGFGRRLGAIPFFDGQIGLVNRSGAPAAIIQVGFSAITHMWLDMRCCVRNC